MRVAAVAMRGLLRHRQPWQRPYPCLLHARSARWSSSPAKPARPPRPAAPPKRGRSDAQMRQQHMADVAMGDEETASDGLGDGNGGGDVLLTRDFIAKSLYNQDTGYFSTKDVINHLPGPLDFGSMLGEWHYRTAVKQAYDSKLSAWMTPVEIFSPHFSNALARYIYREVSKTAEERIATASRNEGKGKRRKSKSAREEQRQSGEDGLVLYEVGGGSGTNALHMLNWLQREDPELYKRTEYTIVEISQKLAERQQERVCAVHKNCRVVNAGVVEWGSSGKADTRPCFFLGMEVLDNLPHDKIAWTTPWSRARTRKSKEGTAEPNAQTETAVVEELCEAVVVKTNTGRYIEDFRPLGDPVIRELVERCPDLESMIKPRHSAPQPRMQRRIDALAETLRGLFGRRAPRPDHRAAFVPTGLVGLLHALRTKLPRHRAIFADFDSFPPGAISTVGGGGGGLLVKGSGSAVQAFDPDSLLAFQAPIVSSRDAATGRTTDYDTYMVPLGSADIFFPTSFFRLSALHKDICRGENKLVGGGVTRRRGVVMKQGAFLQEYGDVRSTRTMTGYNPMLQDYRNASVFLSGEIIDGE